MFSPVIDERAARLAHGRRHALLRVEVVPALEAQRDAVAEAAREAAQAAEGRALAVALILARALTADLDLWPSPQTLTTDPVR